MTKTMHWDHVRLLTEYQLANHYRKITQFERSPTAEVSWQSVRRLGHGELSGGLDNPMIPAIERSLHLRHWTLKYLAEGDKRVLELDNDPEVVRFLTDLLEPSAKRGRSPRRSA